MKLTNKQQQEVDYLKTWYKGDKTITDQVIEEYIQVTVHGGRGGKFSENPLIQAQQRLGITLTMWKEDLTTGLISKYELLEDATCEYEKNLIQSILNSVSPKYRRETIQNNKVVVSELAILNFPDLTKKWTSILNK